MILHQQGPSYVLFNLASKPASAVCWDKLLTWNISLADFVKALLLLKLGTVEHATYAVLASSYKMLPLPGQPRNCRLVSWVSRSIRVVCAELGKLSQTSGYSFA